MISLKFNELIEQISSKIRKDEIPIEIHTICRVNFEEPEELAKDIFKYSGYSAEKESKERLNFRSYFKQNSHLFQSSELDDLIDFLISNQNYYEKIKEYENTEEKLIEQIKSFIIRLVAKHPLHKNHALHLPVPHPQFSRTSGDNSTTHTILP